MSLIGALNIGQKALAVQQAAIQVTGNNIANAGNADYTRQSLGTSPSKDQQMGPGLFIGTGIDLSGITRQVDDALQGRLRGAISDDKSADTVQQWLSRVESTFNELTDDDLSTQMSTFFKGWSNLANTPQDNGLRQVVIQNGASLAGNFNDLSTQLNNLRMDVNSRIDGLASDANGLAQQIANLNGQIVQAEGGTGGMANGLRDTREAAINKLSELMDIKTVPQANGTLNVYVGSEPLVMNADNRGISTKQEVINGAQVSSLIFKRDGGSLTITSGQLGGLQSVRQQIGDVINQTDSLAHNLIFELNKLHGSGQGLSGYTSVTGTNTVDDPTLALNDPKAGLDFTPTNGSFVIHVKDKTTGLESSTLVQVDLDGLNGNDTTLNSLATSLSGVTGVQASVSGGKLTIGTTGTNLEVSFSQDSSGALAALGINNFFTGTDASDIGVNASLAAQPSLLAASKNGEPADNQTALAISQLESASLTGLSGQSLKDAYQSTVTQVGVASANAKTNATAATSVRQTLDAQRETLSGVSLDEEAINLMRQQRAFQGAARLVSAVDELMKTLLAMT